MNLYFRLLWLLITGAFKPSVGVLDVTSLEFRVLPNDLDVNLHMNNGRYATIMDLGRVNLMQRVGLSRPVILNNWLPLISGLKIQFLRPLKLFQKYSLQTRLAYWDEKWFYIEQVFRSNDKDIARGMVRAQIRRGKEAVPVAEIMNTLDYNSMPPELPEDLRVWLKYE